MGNNKEKAKEMQQDTKRTLLNFFLCTPAPLRGYIPEFPPGSRVNLPLPALARAVGIEEGGTMGLMVSGTPLLNGQAQRPEPLPPTPTSCL